MSRYPYESPAHKRFAAQFARQLGLKPAELEQVLGAHPQMLDDLLRVRTELRVLLHKINASVQVQPPPQLREAAVQLYAPSREPAATSQPRPLLARNYRKTISGNAHDPQGSYF